MLTKEKRGAIIVNKPNWKEALAMVFKNLKIIHSSFTGSITFNCHQGKIVDREEKERHT